MRPGLAGLVGVVLLAGLATGVGFVGSDDGGGGTVTAVNAGTHDDRADGGDRPLDVDTDGDGLLDRWERRNETDDGVPLPDADPTHMDVYVRLTPSRGASGVDTDGWLREQFARMPVANPDGSTGITLHVYRGEPIDDRVVYDGSNFFALVEKYNDRAVGDRRGVYHSVVFATFRSTDRRGAGGVAGYNSLVDGSANPVLKRYLVVHELLHNLLGTIDAGGACPADASHYCDGGWLDEWTPLLDRTYLPRPLGEELADGFATGLANGSARDG